MRGNKCLGGWTRGIALLGFSLLLAFKAHAAPVFGKEYTLYQPDGAPVQVRIWGDEFYQHIESLDGYTLIPDPRTREICYAKPTADRSDIESTGLRVGAKGLLKLGITPHIRPARKVIEAQVAEARASIAGPLKSAGGPKAAPTTGPVAGICIIVDFSDSPGTITRTEVNNFCNQEGYTGYGNNGSVRDYYLSVSGNLLNYTNYVHTFSGPGGYFRAPKPKSYYDDPSVPQGTRAVELITAALNAMNGTVNFAQYDGDGDGYVDAVNCFYAGYRTSEWATGLWPHQGGMTWHADGVTVNAYQITDMSDELTIATFCHENGHLVMDWPDLYDYDFDSNGVGNFCLMGYGGAEKNPVQPCAPLKIQANWGTTVNLIGGQNGLSSTAGSNVFYRFDNPNNAAESFLVENRQTTGRDASLPDSGLAIWHVDTDGSNDWNEQLPTRHYLVTLVQADGEWHLEHDMNYGDANDLWGTPYKSAFGATSNPNSNWWSGMPSDFELSNISAPGATMTFDFTQPNLQVLPV
ncbi:MAG: M6 family metalloprotease domain-containing protein, partial [FCB group bacterium]|nr:M6 family metalloprotease domain-containing protein [FCB group bacterium]